MQLRDTFWLWGHGRQCDNIGTGTPDLRGRPGLGRLTTAEAARDMGIPNICRVALETAEQPPFDDELAACAELQQVVWSILGCGTLEFRNDLDDVLRMARRFGNLTGGVMDDFFPTANPEKTRRYSPADVARFRQRLHTEAGRPLDLWVVVYSTDLQYDIKPYLDACDVVTLWTWNANDLPHLEEAYGGLAPLCQGKRLLAGCYMWNFAAREPVPLDMMEFQLTTYRRWLKEGKIEGIVFCHNYLVDIGLEAVDYTREWIGRVGSETLRGETPP